ncbi:hypothetical protein MUN81_05625 [Hymenobacter sp. 5317J-9]|uniref:hypothetical protein n=1 Tax=Hymenobacter sp. 5317J-9 TaxID=2932250 RepID=UPI001FD6A6DD|nr:hypothetical protein [Hymenobacter sp. 5317J-9]UOQ98970.1 hypothetical protein MUN81_05625 [Hymenobacter sp. 5317J-9]
MQLQLGLGFHQVQWHGWVLVPTPGVRRREAVYWLGPAFWDCCWESELFGLGQRPDHHKT